MSSLRIVLADDHALVRAGLSALLRGIDGVQIVLGIRDIAGLVRYAVRTGVITPEE